MRRLTVMLASALLAGAVFADAADDAEAKRRGVPVSQVQAENALAAEKHKTADQEKQLAALQEQLAKLQGGTVTPAGAMAATAAGPRSCSSSCSGKATMGAMIRYGARSDPGRRRRERRRPRSSSPWPMIPVTPSSSTGAMSRLSWAAFRSR